ncbi:tyrosine-protein phosphatase (plasmid) [Coraliomargarita sp. W4R53]
MSTIQIEGTHNFRDTGGTPLTAGGVTRSGVLFRSDAFSALTDTGREQLAATDIGVVVDLRTETERAMTPNLLPTTRQFHVVELPLLEGAVTGLAKGVSDSSDPVAAKAAVTAAIAQLPTLGELYVSMLEGGATSFAEFARLVAASTQDPPTAVVVHCTAGKDRTGVSVALALEAVGAERSAVIADYTASAANLAGPWAERMRAMITGMGVPLTPNVDALVTGTPPEAIEAALAWVDERGGAAAYLQSGGLTDGELAQLRARMTS